jgi:energy-coupling factor transport system permease protein
MSRRLWQVPMVPEMAYQKSDSFMHRLHPIAKLVFIICYFILVIVLANIFLSIILLILILVLVRASKIPLTLFAKRTRFILVFSIVLFLAQIVFNHQGKTLFTLIPSFIPFIGGAIPVTNLGIESGVVIACRFLSIITSSYLFVSTTHPNEFAYALMQAGLPYRYGFTLIITLRFLPLFGSEFGMVRKAQLARGMEVSIKPSKIMRTLRLTFLPLLVSGMSKVEALSISMEGRGFGYSNRRTFIRKIRTRRVDTVVTAAIVSFTVAACVWTIWFGLPFEYHI